ncbi:MAG: hypothetical protein C5B49_04320 [Bdellovibrio sp.]|nr:MAG: hypothetical protein C5B49_04320 [Bdellovibrio sp.]
MSMSKQWIMVFNRADAKIFNRQPFQLIETIPNELGRAKNKEMTSDKPGSSRTRIGGASTTYSLTGEKDPHEDAAIQFCRQLAEHLNKSHLKHQFDKLLLVAEPKMKGHLHRELGKDVLATVEWLEKDFAHLSEAELRDRLGLPSERAGVANAKRS